ncbi:MAG TPA: hypothetical protein DDX54_05640 [Rhodospirillaceae bacterium]|nr:hypothetical protein [Rhodospirillaceae bacterium]
MPPPCCRPATAQIPPCYRSATAQIPQRRRPVTILGPVPRQRSAARAGPPARTGDIRLLRPITLFCAAARIFLLTKGYGYGNFLLIEREEETILCDQV